MTKLPSDKNLTTRQEAERQTWQYRAVLATRGNQTQLGCLVLAVIGKEPKGPPKYGHTATIKDIDGAAIITADLMNNRGVSYADVVVGTVQQVAGEFNRLADTIKATDEERLDMFNELRKWISVDERALKERPMLPGLGGTMH